jgi:glutamine amidotransferase
MTAATITILDHGTGNLFSVARAVEACGGTARIVSTPEEVAKADKLILPGVGTFGNGIANLRARGLDQAFRDKVVSGTPVLAICLGMQMLFSESNEFGLHQGLNLLPGRVVSLAEAAGERPCRIPQIGWNGLYRGQGQEWRDSLLDRVQEGSDVYFVHSFCVLATRPEDVQAVTHIGTTKVAAVVARDNLTGCQFHPEKSGAVGLSIINRLVSA